MIPKILHLRSASAAAAALLVSAGCGLEGLVNEFAGAPYTQPVSSIRGSVSLSQPKLTVVDSAGNELTPFQATADGGTYDVDLYSGSYSGLRVRATRGNGIVESFVPELAAESAVSGVDVGAKSTAKVQLVEGLLGPNGKALSNLSDDLVCIMGKKLDARFAQAGPEAAVLAMVERLAANAGKVTADNKPVFQTPSLAADYTVVKSALNPAWASAANFDYTGDGTLDTTTGDFDQAFVAAAQGLDFSAPPDPYKVRVIFQVNFNAGQLDGNCQTVNRFKWVRDEPGKQMFFVGGIHKDSPIQDTVIDAMLGNRGGWTPNQVKMYDDGTHGDKAAGDNIWTITFDLPRTLRMAYKYTWGKQGQLWTGTEEWPGNQRLLEITDVNGDGYVYRSDVFGDEATNKDLSNLNPAAAGALDWNEDLNGDGVPEAREDPMIGKGCNTFQWITPDWVPVLTVSCKDFVPN